MALAAAFSDSQAQTPQTAQNSPSNLKDLTLEQLSQLEVTTPSKEPVSAMQTPAAVYVLTSEDIRRAGVTNIPDALRLAPGVEVAQIDSSKWSIGIRGFGTRLSRDVLVLIDGREVYTPLFAGTYWEVQNLVLQDVDRIEVIRGPGGAIWGPNAVNGVINIITKNSKDTQGEFVSAGGGNYEHGFGNARYGGTAGGFTYRAYVMGFARGPEYHPDGQNFDSWHNVQGGFRLDSDSFAGGAFSAEGDIYRVVAGERVQAVTYAPPFEQIVDGNAYLSGGNINLRWRRALKGGGDIQFQAYYDRTNRFEPNLAGRRNTYSIDFVAHQPAGGRHQITWGLSARFSQAQNPEVVSGLVFLPENRTDNLMTAFFQDEIAIVDHRLSLVAGTKMLHTNFTGLAFEPSVRLLWTPGDRQTVWAAYTHAVRTPSDAEENFYLSGLVGLTPGGIAEMARFNANPNFAPEQLNGYELGYRRLFGQNFYIDLASFYNHYHNLFSEEFTGPVFFEENPPPPHYLLPAQFGNGLLGTTRGVEAAPEWRPSQRWRLRGSYSYLYMNISRAPHSLDVGTAPGIVGASPQHEGTIESSWNIGKSIQLDLVYRYVSQLPAQSVPSYSTGDARIAWRFKPKLELSVVGRNLLQPHHPEYAGDPATLLGIRRNVFVMLTWGQ